MTTTSFLIAPVRCALPPGTIVSRLINVIPGQIELYTHHPFLPTLVRQLQRMGMRVCATYLIESQFMEDKYKFFRSVAPMLFDESDPDMLLIM